MPHLWIRHSKTKILNYIEVGFFYSPNIQYFDPVNDGSPSGTLLIT